MRPLGSGYWRQRVELPQYSLDNASEPNLSARGYDHGRSHLLDVRNWGKHDRQTALNAIRILLMLGEVLIVDTRREFKVNVIVVKKLRSAQNNAEVYV